MLVILHWFSEYYHIIDVLNTFGFDVNSAINL